MNNATMLYKFGNSVILDCGSFDTIIVDEADVETEVKNGWSLHPLECKQVDGVETEGKKRSTKAKSNVVD